MQAPASGFEVPVCEQDLTSSASKIKAYVLNRHLKTAGTLAGINFRLTRHAGVEPFRPNLKFSIKPRKLYAVMLYERFVTARGIQMYSTANTPYTTCSHTSVHAALQHSLYTPLSMKITT